MHSQNIENILHCSCFICSCSCSNSLAISGNFFLLMNSSSSDLMSYCTLAIEFLALNYYTNSLFYRFFLSHPDFFFSLILSVASFFFFFFLINQMKSEKIKEKREKRETCSWAKELIQTQTTKQNPILKINLNQNKQVWKKKKKKTSRSDPAWRWRPSWSLPIFLLSLCLCISLFSDEKSNFFFFFEEQRSKWDVAGRFWRRKG